LEYLRALELTDRQIRAVEYVKEKGTITNREYRDLTGRMSRMAAYDLDDRVRKGILVREGTTGRSTRYRAANAQNLR